MTAKAYLSEIKWLRNSIKISKQIVENFHISYESMHGMDYSADKVQSSPKNSLEEAGWKMLQDHQDAIQQLARSTTELNHRLDMIKNLSSPAYSQILYLHYYSNIDIGTIAARMQRSYKTIANLHTEALTEFECTYAQEIAEDDILVRARRSGIEKVAL